MLLATGRFNRKHPGKGNWDMTRGSASLSMAGILLCWSAAFHVFSVLVAGVHFSTVLLLLFGIAYFGIARSFLKGSTYWTKFAFPVMVAGAGGAYLMTRMNLAVPSWWLVPIVWLETAVAVLLLVHFARR